jgi:hypothetical protein
MKKGIWAIAAALGVSLGAATSPASAAPPLGADAAGMKAAVTEASPIEKARWVRRCWRDWRGRHCRRVWVGPRFGWAPYYGPSFGLYFGGGRRHHWRGHRFSGGRHFRGGARGFRPHGFSGRGRGGGHRR